MVKTLVVLAALAGFLAVALGAFGAHALKARLAPELLTVFQTGVQYHFYHALALLGVAILLILNPHMASLILSAGFFIAGIVLFSGSLYVLSVFGIRWVGAITPIGGLAFLVGWGLLGWSGYKLAGT